MLLFVSLVICLLFFFLYCFFFFFKQKTAYEMRISDWSSDVCSSDLVGGLARRARGAKDRAIVLAQDLEPRCQIIGVANGWFDSKRGAEKGAAHLGEIGRASCRERVCQYV